MLMIGAEEYNNKRMIMNETSMVCDKNKDCFCLSMLQVVLI